MNLMSGLMAGANFATGYQQGQQQRLQQNMQQLAYQNAQLQEQQNQVNMKRAQAESDYAMSLFNPQVQNPVTGQTIGGNPVVSPEQQYANNMYKVANFAGTQGDLPGAGQYGTQAINAQGAMQQQALHQAQLGNEQLKRSAALGQEGAQAAAMFPPTSQGAQQFLAYMLANGNLTPQEFTNLQNGVQQLGPNWKDGIIAHGTKQMDAYQQVEAKNAQTRIANTQTFRQQQQGLAEQRLAETKDYHQRSLAARKQTGDKHLTFPSQTAQEDQAWAAASQLSGSKVAASGGQLTLGDSKWDSFARDLQAGAAALAQRDPNMTYPQAVRQYISAAKASGELPETPNKPTSLQNFMGRPGTGTTISYQPKGQSIEQAIPYQKGMPMMVGHYYSSGGGIFQYTGKDLVRVK